ncbi:hypothetical protein [uncultured Campylobacter sp.]|uniref:hypothetical protein n=1 Tax=uncultured Campylobacter sp. TaxID=218934 RepID=UPI002635360B|nr:hypothetical protein [uncultured Campylobacter sp.]
MATISEFIISACELVEAQADEIRVSFQKSLGAIIWSGLVALLCFVGFVFLIVAIFFLAKKFLGLIAALFLSSFAAFLSALLVFLIVKIRG